MTLACGFDSTPEGDLLVASTGAPDGVRRFSGRTGACIDMFATLSTTSTPTDIVVETFIRPVRGTMLIVR